MYLVTSPKAKTVFCHPKKKVHKQKKSMEEDKEATDLLQKTSQTKNGRCCKVLDGLVSRCPWQLAWTPTVWRRTAVAFGANPWLAFLKGLLGNSFFRLANPGKI